MLHLFRKRKILNHTGTTNKFEWQLVVGHRLEIIIDHWLESVAAVDAIF